MTDTPTPGTPSTEAGRALLRRYEEDTGLFPDNSRDWSEDWHYGQFQEWTTVIDLILAIEQEAARAAAAERDAALERLREAYDAYRRHEATLSEQVYWRALDEAIRAALSASPAPAAPEIDVERLAAAISIRALDGRKSALIRPRLSYRDLAADIAAEYARLSDNP